MRGNQVSSGRMNRRQFISSSGVAALALGSDGLAAEPRSSVPRRASMKLGCQSRPTNDTHLKYLARYGVRNICGYPEIGGRHDLCDGR